jgi:hypothetical protein
MEEVESLNAKRQEVRLSRFFDIIGLMLVAVRHQDKPITD